MRNRRQFLPPLPPVSHLSTHPLYDPFQSNEARPADDPDLTLKMKQQRPTLSSVINRRLYRVLHSKHKHMKILPKREKLEKPDFSFKIKAGSNSAFIYYTKTIKLFLVNHRVYFLKSPVIHTVM